MSGTHAETAKAQADVQRADAQHGKPNIPPGHVETRRGIKRLPTSITGPVIGVGAVIVIAIVVLVVLFT